MGGKDVTEDVAIRIIRTAIDGGIAYHEGATWITYLKKAPPPPPPPPPPELPPPPNPEPLELRGDEDIVVPATLERCDMLLEKCPMLNCAMPDPTYHRGASV